MSEFSHYSNHTPSARHAENCSGCALTIPVMIDHGNGVEKMGINYSGWPLSYIQNGRLIPKEFYGYLLEELESDNLAYVANLKNKLAAAGYSIGAIQAIVKQGEK